MKKAIPTQLIVGLGILLVGAGIVGGEYLLVRWLPGHQENVREKALAPIPYKNDDMGIEMQVAAGIDGKTEPFAGGVRMFSSRLWSNGPSLTITSQPNPDQSPDFSPYDEARWQTDGDQHALPRYHYEQTQINDRNAVLIWQLKGRAMVLTARIIAPAHLVEANCTPGNEDESLYMQACDDSVRSIKVAGPPTPPPPALGEQEIPTVKLGHK